jgi:hypothetical protein
LPPQHIKPVLPLQQQRKDNLALVDGVEHFVAHPGGLLGARRHHQQKHLALVEMLFDDLIPSLTVVDFVIQPHGQASLYQGLH